MYSVMIVDDERHLVEAMEQTLPWAKLEVDQVFKAYSAEHALQLFKTSVADIVITDIRMPGMSGLELIQEIRKLSKQTKCILLSGYSEFEYARQALSLDAVQYLLKPATDEELMDAIALACEQHREQWLTIASEQKALSTIRDHLPLLQSNLLQDLLAGHRLSDTLLSERLTLYHLPFQLSESAAMLLIRVEMNPDRMDVRHRPLMEYAISNIAEEILNEHYDVWLGKDVHEQQIIIVKARAAEAVETLLESKAAELQLKVKQFLRLSVSVVVSTWFTMDRTAIKECYDRSLSILRQKAGNGEALFITGGEAPQFENTSTIRSLYEPPLLHQYIDAGKWEAFEERLHEIFAELEQQWSDSVEHIMEVFFAVTGAFSYLAHKNGMRLYSLIGEDHTMLFNGTALSSIPRVKEWVFQSLSRLKAHFTDNMKGNRQSIIEQVQHHVMEQLGHDLSLYDIAERIDLHPVYLSRIFKLETGESLTEYVYRLKMEKAAYLLKHSELKIYEIATSLGYQNPQYLSKLFRRQYQMTPQEYRDNI
ncbi:response regulator [Paenibacillus sp. strain BS8-2]